MQVLFILGAKSLSLSTPVFLSLMERGFFYLKKLKLAESDFYSEQFLLITPDVFYL